jgi:hypothetical protein
MKISVTEFYLDPKTTFDISYKVYKYLDQCFNKALKKAEKKAGLADVELFIVINTKRKIKKPQLLKRSKYKDRYKHVILLPYDVLRRSKNFKYDFVGLTCDAILDILAGHKVPLEYLSNVKAACLDEIPGNPKYIYTDESLGVRNRWQGE